MLPILDMIKDSTLLTFKICPDFVGRIKSVECVSIIPDKFLLHPRIDTEAYVIRKTTRQMVEQFDAVVLGSSRIKRPKNYNFYLKRAVIFSERNIAMCSTVVTIRVYYGYKRVRKTK
jgi:hypothetical protein